MVLKISKNKNPLLEAGDFCFSFSQEKNMSE